MAKLVPLDRQRLAEHGVDLVKSGGGWMLVCQECGYSWPVPVHILGRDYWVCPQNYCNIAKPEPLEPWPEWEEPEPEPVEEPRPKDDRDRWLRSYTFNIEEAKVAETDEARERFESEAQRFFELYLRAVHQNTEVENDS